MAEQTAAPTLAGRFGAKATAAAAAANKAPVRYGPESLPPGIKGGIGRVTGARLVQLGQDAKKKQLDGSSAAGQLQLVIDAAAVEPKEVVGPGGAVVKVTGRRFKSLFFPLFERGAAFWPAHVPFAPTEQLDFAGCIREAVNFMKCVAGEKFDCSNFDAAVQAFGKLQPHFTFDTVLKPAGGKNPTTGQPYPESVQEFWGRGVQYKGGGPGAGVKDNTAAAAAPAAAPPPAADPAPFDETAGDLASLAALADADPDAAATDGTPEFEAATRLTEAAAQAGMSEEDMATHASWADIVAAITAPAEGGDTAGDDAVEDDAVEDDAVEEEEEAPKEWEKGDECEWVPPVKGPGGKEKPGTKTVRCKITGLNKSKTKANVVDAKDPKKKWENVAVDLLTRPA